MCVCVCVCVCVCLQRVKIKESKKIDKYLDVTRESWKMKVAGIPIVDGVLKMVLKNLEKKGELEIRGIIKTIHTRGLLKSA